MKELAPLSRQDFSARAIGLAADSEHVTVLISGLASRTDVRLLGVARR